MAKFKVYLHIFPNLKMYVGITGQSLERRWRNGKGYAGQPVEKAIEKYGWENIQHIILFDGLTKEQAEEKEIELISKLKTLTHENGYNVEKGGHCSEISEETKRKLSEAKKGQMAGEKHWHYGKSWDEAVKKKISEARKGKTMSEATKEKHRKRFSGAGNPMYGTKMTAEHKAKLQAACVKATSKPVICVETGIVYKSAAEASRKTGVNSRGISYVCNKDKRYKTAGGYHWNYAEVI